MLLQEVTKVRLYRICYTTAHTYPGSSATSILVPTHTVWQPLRPSCRLHGCCRPTNRVRQLPQSHWLGKPAGNFGHHYCTGAYSPELALKLTWNASKGKSCQCVNGSRTESFVCSCLFHCQRCWLPVMSSGVHIHPTGTGTRGRPPGWIPTRPPD